MKIKAMVYIGVVGQIAAGKEILADYLIKKYGFRTFSLSTVIHLELKKRGVKKIDRKMLQDVGDELRHKEGDDVLAKKTIEYLKLEVGSGRLEDEMRSEKKNPTSHIKNLASHVSFPTSIIITGIRNPAEVKYFKKIKGFVLVAVKAQRKIRFKRVLARGKRGDPVIWKEFYKIDKRDYGIGQGKSGQQVGKCLKLADYTITNNQDKKSFYQKIEKLLKGITRER